MITEFLEILDSVMINAASNILGISSDIFKVLFEKRKIVDSEKNNKKFYQKKQIN